MNQNTHALTEQTAPSPLEYSPCPTCGAERDWSKPYECVMRRPTYDELALAVLAWDRAMRGGPLLSGSALDVDRRALWSAGDRLHDLARRLEPGG